MTRPGEHVSPQWAQWRAAIDLDEYEARFAHDAAHGEADLLASLVVDGEPARSVLDAGCGTGRVAIELHRRGLEVVGTDLDDDLLALARRKAPAVTWVHADLATVRLDRTFDVVAMPGNVMLYCRPDDRPALVASCAAHLRPGGLLVAGFSLRPGELGLDEYDAHAAAAGLDLVERWAGWDRSPFRGGEYAVSIHTPV
ncbi:MAG: class I SAM-dependent methyltransferase [Acidimicrobiales bacterium]